MLTSEVLWYSPESNSTTSAQATVLHNEFASNTSKITTTSPRSQWVKPFVHNIFQLCGHDIMDDSQTPPGFEVNELEFNQEESKDVQAQNKKNAELDSSSDTGTGIRALFQY